MPSNVISPSIVDGDLFLAPCPSHILDRLQQRLIGSAPAPIYLCLTFFKLEHFDNALYPLYDIPLTQDLLRAVDKRRAEYLAARICAKESLLYLGIQDLPFRKDGDRQPYWPSFTVGSLTHSHHVAASAVADDASIRSTGVDIEQWIDTNRIDRLASTILTPSELSFWEGLGTDKAAWLTRIFSAKESLYKLLYPITGKSFFFQDAEVDVASISDESFTLYLTTELTSEYPQGYAVPINYMDTEDWVITFTFLAT